MVPFSFSGKCDLSNHQATVWPAFFIPNSLLVRFPLLSPIELWTRLVALFPKNHRRIVFIQPKQTTPNLSYFITFHHISQLQFPCEYLYSRTVQPQKSHRETLVFWFLKPIAASPTVAPVEKSRRLCSRPVGRLRQPLRWPTC